MADDKLPIYVAVAIVVVAFLSIILGIIWVRRRRQRQGAADDIEAAVGKLHNETTHQTPYRYINSRTSSLSFRSLIETGRRAIFVGAGGVKEIEGRARPNAEKGIYNAPVRNMAAMNSPLRHPVPALVIPRSIPGSPKKIAPLPLQLTKGGGSGSSTSLPPPLPPKDSLLVGASGSGQIVSPAAALLPVSPMSITTAGVTTNGIISPISPAETPLEAPTFISRQNNSTTPPVRALTHITIQPAVVVPAVTTSVSKAPASITTTIPPRSPTPHLGSLESKGGMFMTRPLTPPPQEQKPYQHPNSSIGANGKNSLNPIKVKDPDEYSIYRSATRNHGSLRMTLRMSTSTTCTTSTTSTAISGASTILDYRENNAARNDRGSMHPKDRFPEAVRRSNEATVVKRKPAPGQNGAQAPTLPRTSLPMLPPRRKPPPIPWPPPAAATRLGGPGKPSEPPDGTMTPSKGDTPPTSTRVECDPDSPTQSVLGSSSSREGSSSRQSISQATTNMNHTPPTSSASDRLSRTPTWRTASSGLSLAGSSGRSVRGSGVGSRDSVKLPGMDSTSTLITTVGFGKSEDSRRSKEREEKGRNEDNPAEKVDHHAELADVTLARPTLDIPGGSVSPHRPDGISTAVRRSYISPYDIAHRRSRAVSTEVLDKNGTSPTSDPSIASILKALASLQGIQGADESAAAPLDSDTIISISTSLNVEILSGRSPNSNRSSAAASSPTLYTQSSRSRSGSRPSTRTTSRRRKAASWEQCARRKVPENGEAFRKRTMPAVTGQGWDWGGGARRARKKTRSGARRRRGGGPVSMVVVQRASCSPEDVGLKGSECSYERLRRVGTV